jgi:5-methylthioadenosine/S-adenosylhomocysteine deaminase
MSDRVLIKGGTVLSLDRSVGNMATGDVLIEDGIITEVGTGLRARNAETVDATDSIVMPGFVDTHRHAWHALFRGVASQPPSPAPSVLAQHHRPEHVYAATLIGLLGAAEAGITTVVDWADIPGEAPYIEAALEAHYDVGLRTVFVAADADWGDTTVAVERARTAVDYGGGQNLTIGFGSKTPDSGGREDVSREWAVARELNLRIHAHVGTNPASRGHVARLGAAGLLGEDVTLVHCTHLDATDLDAIASSKARVSVTPVLEMTGGLGSPPLQALIDRQIRPGLGIGSEMGAPGDMFAQMRSANSLQHATLFDLKLAGKGGVPNLLTTRDVIRYATIDGAVAVGLEDSTGSLRPGKRGDIVVLRTDRPNIAPVNDPIGAVVWGMDTSNIDWVFVGGRALVRDGALTADVARASDLAAVAQREVAAAAGLHTSAVEPV